MLNVRSARRSISSMLSATSAGTLGMPSLQLRAGVVTGEVAVNLGATGQGMVAGDAVNTAARIQAAAQAGSVWVDGTTRATSRAAIAYEDRGDHALKGKSEPVHALRGTPGGRGAQRR